MRTYHQIQRQKMRVAYVSGAYRAPTIRQVVKNIRIAEEVAVQLWQFGFSVICPHTNTQLFDGIFTKDEKVLSPADESNGQRFVEGDIEMINRLTPGYDIIVMLRGHLYSGGARQELDCARIRGLLVYYWLPGKGRLKELKELGKDKTIVNVETVTGIQPFKV